jgi:3-oxoacyl-(acyl-carrier-protein) synthase/NADPH:quinone reductase-like Zn-dependent oxidoreductase
MSVEYSQTYSTHTNTYAMTGTGHCFAAGRFSYVLGLHGHCEAIDVACSAALVACHNASRCLLVQDARNALTAGVNMMFMPATLESYASSGLTSPSGKAFVFDERANGFIRGEGCGVGVLQVAAEVHGRVLGSAVRQDGRSASLTAPNGRAQHLLMSQALANANMPPAEIRLVEAAANGSALGDPVEAGAIANALISPRAQAEGLHVGSVKASIGHTESASGISGMVKLLCALRHAQASPNAQLAVLAGHVATVWERSSLPMGLPTQISAMPAGPSCGTVCSFGLGGTIASVILRVTTPGLGVTVVRMLVYRRRSHHWRRPTRVRIAIRGAISGMVLSEQPAFLTALAPGHVEMQIRAVGLNFRDVLLVLGEYPGPLEPPGSDCSAIEVQFNHELFGFAPGCLTSFVRARTDALLTTKRPASVSAQEACTLPSTWSTVHEVVRRAQSHGQQRFLLHAATGGVGLVMIEYLHWLRLPIHASAGQPSKHQIARDFGVAASCSSRSAIAFVYSMVRHLSGNRLYSASNSLSDDYIVVCFALLGEKSSLQEIGKRSAWSLLRMASASVSHPSVLDLASDAHGSSGWFNELLRILAARVESRITHGLPVTEFSMSKVQEAFNLLKAGSNVGKIVITSPITRLVHVQLRSDSEVPEDQLSGNSRGRAAAARSILSLLKQF